MFRLKLNPKFLLGLWSTSLILCSFASHGEQNSPSNSANNPLQFNSVDTDGDLMPDQWELSHGFDVNDPADSTIDSDGDEFSNLREYLADTDPNDNADKPQLISELTFSFEDGQLPKGWRKVINRPNGQTFTNSWTVTSNQQTDGLNAIQTTPDSFGSAIQWSGLFAGGDIVFDVMQLQASGYGGIGVFVDNKVVTGVFTHTIDNLQWRTRAITISPGFHTIRLSYWEEFSHDNPHMYGAGWLDNIRVGDFSTLDTDSDGIPDVWEFNHDLDINDPADAALDTDNDGLSTLEEFVNGTDMNLFDSDEDMMPDGWEVAFGLDPNNSEDSAQDFDNDGFDNRNEYLTGSDPTDANVVPPMHSQWQESFEANTLPPGWLTAATRQTGWLISNDAASVGQNSLSATATETAPFRQMNWSAWFEAGFLLYDVKNPQALGANNVRVTVDAQTVDLIDSQDEAWQTSGIWLDAGFHTIGWILSKDRNNGDTADAKMWLDNIVFGPGSDIDSDGDLIPDYWEIVNGLDSHDPTDALADPDNDGLNNLAEYRHGSDINNADSDGDALPDGWEVNNGLNPADAEDANGDADGDGVSNVAEYWMATDPTDSDDYPQALSTFSESFENEGMPQAWQLEYESYNAWQVSPSDASDGVNSLQAFIAPWQNAGINQSVVVTPGYLLFDVKAPANRHVILKVDDNPDIFLKSSGDWKTHAVLLDAGFHRLRWHYGLSTSDFVGIDNLRFGVSTELDSDEDGIPDIWEVIHELDYTDPLDALLDPDADGLTNVEEYRYGTDRLSGDSDYDGMADLWEINQGFDPLMAADALLDNDSDGYNNVVEYKTETDPLDGADYPPTLIDYRPSLEVGQLPQGWLKATDTPLGWTVTQMPNVDDDLVLQSLLPGPNQRAEVQWSGIFSAGYLAFDYQFGWAPNQYVQQFQLWVDDKPVLKDTHTGGWATGLAYLTAGFHTIRWVNWNYSDVEVGDIDVKVANLRFAQVNVVDSDADGIPDFWEIHYSLDHNNAEDADDDLDSDGLSNLIEYQLGTAPDDLDSDDDLLPDGWEVQYGLDPLDSGEGRPDSDGDGLSDIVEYYFGSRPDRVDSDGDGHSDYAEYQQNTDPMVADTDNDGIANGDDTDDDNDGLSDDVEIAAGLNPLDPNDVDADTDGDGFSNIDEWTLGSNPTDATSVPASLVGWLPLLLKEG